MGEEKHLSSVFSFALIHTIQVIDNIETLRDIISGTLDVYLSSVSNNMNEVMKVFTIVATIFISIAVHRSRYLWNEF